jgi:hypothetical protein
MSLDFVKYREIHGLPLFDTFRAMILESILDIALLLFALTLSVYLHNTFLVTLSSGFVRSEFTLIQFFGIFFAKLRILENCFEIFTYFHSYMHTPSYGKRSPITRAEWLSAVLATVCIGLLLAAIPLYWGRLGDLWYILRLELSIFA